jgi:hypothetical protein
MDVTPRSVIVKVTGDTSGTEFAGTFKVKPLLSHGEQMEVDRIRREILGPRPSDATPRAFSQATLFAECQMRIVPGEGGSPSWWRDNNGGMNLFDDNVVKTVYAQVEKVENDFRKELADAAEAAKKEIAAVNVMAKA